MFRHTLVYSFIGLCAISAATVAGAVGTTGARAGEAAGPFTSCSSSAPCLTEANAGTGPGLASSSSGGTGLTGSTKLSSLPTKFAAGVLGNDASTTGTSNSGVTGTSKNGTGVTGASKKADGVVGTSGATLGNPALAGVVGNSTGGGVGVAGNGGIGISGTGGIGVLGSGTGANGIGLSGISPNVGVQAYSNTIGGISLLALGTGGYLMDAETNFTSVFAMDGGGNMTAYGYGAFGNANTSSGVIGTGSDSGIVGYAISPSSPYGAVYASGNGGLLFQGVSAASTDVFHVDDAGNVVIAGLIYTAGGCSTGCAVHGQHQRRVVSYAPRESQPTMEDVGEAQLINGEARVSLEHSFANVIDRNANYLVFVTPEGDCNGLFIAGKTPSGFTVRELRGGHASLAFEYRIVAKPYGDAPPRLPMTDIRFVSRPALQHLLRHHP